MTETFLAVAAKYQKYMPETDYLFLQRVYTTSQDVYRERLKAIGFENLGRVLDAGCGFGQWALALESLGNSVVAVDRDPIRIHFMDNLLATLEKSRIETVCRSMLDFSDEPGSYEGILCYGSIFTVPWREALARLIPMLKPEGLLYLSVNDIGYLLHMWTAMPYASSAFNPRDKAALAFRNTIDYELYGKPNSDGQIAIAWDDLRKHLESLGMEIVDKSGEGRINLRPGEANPKPFFAEEYHGLPGCYEVVARRKK